ILCVLGYSALSWGQVMTFNSPAPWLTQRNDSILVKAQLDTSKFVKKQLTLSLSKVEAGKKKPVLAKTFKVKDFTQDFFMGMAGASLIGGKDYLRVAWSNPGAKDSGYCAPIGIVNIDKIAKVQPVHATKVVTPIDLKDIAGLVKDKKFTKVGAEEFMLLWNTKTLSIIIKKSAAKGAVKFTFDGKNAKNAFVSFADKMLDYVTDKDSIFAYENDRVCSDSITYTPKVWINEIKKVSDKDYALVTIPWYDIGLLPFDGRVMGFGAFAAPAAYPEKAVVFNPGSWGNVVLDK
ncbi:MAG: hypothetical protein WBM07_14075, partial [Chitinivibrionales bacterium]